MTSAIQQANNLDSFDLIVVDAGIVGLAHAYTAVQRGLKDCVIDRDVAASLAHGMHLIVVQSADGSLVVGDSHPYADAPEPFAIEEVDRLILRHLRSTLNLETAQIIERWTGVYPS